MSSSSSSSASSSITGYADTSAAVYTIFTPIGCDCTNRTILFLAAEDRGHLLQISRQFHQLFYAKTFKQDSLPENHRHLAEIFVQLVSVDGFTSTLGCIYSIAYRTAFHQAEDEDQISLIEFNAAIIYRQLMRDYRMDLVQRIMSGLSPKDLLSLNCHINKNGNDLSPQRMNSTIQRIPSLPSRLLPLLNTQLGWSLTWYRKKKEIIYPEKDQEEKKEEPLKVKRRLEPPSAVLPSKSISQVSTSQSIISQMSTQPLSSPEEEGTSFSFKRFKETEKESKEKE